jgi:hypothetical protein
MLNNLTNFFNLIVGRRIKTQLEPSDLIAVGTKQSPALGDYKPTAIQFSDLQAQLGGGGGGGNLQQVTDLGNTTTNNINLINSAIVLDNGSLLQKGFIDNGADGGIARICSIGYQDEWENGVQYFVAQNSNQIVWANSINTTVPDNNFDITMGYVPGSIFHDMNNHNKYICTDNTNGAAVWDPYYDAVETDGVTITGDGTLGSPLVAAGASLPSWLESNATDLTIWNNGQGNVASNTSYGDGALRNAAAISSNNTAIGGNALSLMQSGVNNTAIGQASLLNNLSSYNTAVGASALFSNTTGSGNTAVGSNTLLNNTTGFQNTAVGQIALVFNTTGNYNTVLGAAAGFSNTTGSGNVAIGLSSLQSNTTGFENVAIGLNSLAANTTGVGNTAIGASTDSGNFNESVILGKNATATGNNQFVIGSVLVNAGAVTAEVNASSNVWNVVINGVARKILLA